MLEGILQICLPQHSLGVLADELDNDIEALIVDGYEGRVDIFVDQWQS